MNVKRPAALMILAVVAISAAISFRIWTEKVESQRVAKIRQDQRTIQAARAGANVLAMCMLIYSGDHGGRLPQATTWRADIRPYFGDQQWAVPFLDQYDLAPDVAGKRYIKDPGGTVMLKWKKVVDHKTITVACNFMTVNVVPVEDSSTPTAGNRR